VSNAPADEYLTVEQVATRLQLSVKSIQNKMARRIIRAGIRESSSPNRERWSSYLAPRRFRLKSDGIIDENGC
jgi:hypothetical protein